MNNMLDKKYKHERIKKKSKPFKDKEYLAWLHNQELKCFACGGYATMDDGIELHHVKETSSDKRNDNEVIPLHGIKCHRLGVELSAHLTPKKFRETFPVGAQLKYAKELYNRYLRYKEELC